ncbi:hydroxyneurosporene synthase [Fusarium sporotrichioides]|uniref:Hydroxyneurosporene synthase n=1 Tax=Fusarium sporotrichioides TaxID=5514 RepID=A0A395RH88_FUSSP|nr:hydroxyneurosporene synthase [Fusarium sporotrichioides]
MVALKYATFLALSGYALTAPDKSATRHLNLPAQCYNGTVKVEHLSVDDKLDGFKMQTSAAIGTADFWYFDVFLEATNQTLNVVLFNSEALADEGISISNGLSGVRGDWKGIGSFKGSSPDKRNIEYVIRLDSAEMEISGSIKFKSIAPTHYPYDLNGATNAMPDAKTVFNRKGNKSIIGRPRYWDRGHGRLGPYSIVWYSHLDYEGNESRNSYIVKDVRQKGDKASWPPTTGLLETEGLTVNYSLPDG